MPDQDKFKETLQQTIATCVAFCDDENARAVSLMVQPYMFDKPLDTIVERCLNFRKKFGDPPGKNHIDDVLSDVLDNKEHQDHKLYVSVLNGMLSILDQNTSYILSEVNTFIKLKKVRDGITKAAVIYNQGGDNVFEELNSVFRQNLKIGDENKDYGFSLADPRALGFLDRNETEFCKIGIPELDMFGCHPTKKEILHFQAARNRGKSQFAGHCGKFGLLKGWNVVHYTLENSAVMTSQRYFQSLFSGAKRVGEYYTSTFDMEDGKPVHLRRSTITPEFFIENRDQTRDYLKKNITKFSKLNNLRIREFPTGKLSMDALEQDLDELATIEKFVPDMIIIDYPQMMRLDRRKNSHDSLLEIFIDIRGLCVERNVAGVTTGQSDREGEKVSTQRSYHAAGSIGIFNVVDNGITFSQTDDEERLGLARLYTQKVRNDKARYNILITQNYATGQFCLESHLMNDSYKSLMKDAIKSEEWVKDHEEIEEERDSRQKLLKRK